MITPIQHKIMPYGEFLKGKNSSVGLTNYKRRYNNKIHETIEGKMDNIKFEISNPHDNEMLIETKNSSILINKNGQIHSATTVNNGKIIKMRPLLLDYNA